MKYCSNCGKTIEKPIYSKDMSCAQTNAENPPVAIEKEAHSSRYLPTIRASREASSPSKIRPVAEEPPELWVIQKVLVG